MAGREGTETEAATDGHGAEGAGSTGGAESTEGTDGSALGFALGTGAGLVALFLLLRLFAVAAWDWQSVGAIADTLDFSDAAAIFLGTFLGAPILTGILLAVLLPLAVIRLTRIGGAKRISLAGVIFPIALAVACASWVGSFRQFWLPLVAVGVAIVLVLMHYLSQKERSRDLVVALVHRIGAIVVVAFLAVAVVVETPWVSHEELVTTSGTIDGYVLESDSGFLHVLTDARDVVIVPSKTVTSRTIVP